MNYDAFLPFVRIEVANCPIDTAVAKVRQAAITWCTKTGCWVEDLDEVEGDGYSTEFEMALDDQVEIADLLKVRVGPDEVPIVPPRELRDLDGHTSRQHAATDDRRTLRLLIAPKDQEAVKVFAALKPSLTSFSFPDALFAHHAQDIATGAIAELCAMDDMPWTNQTKAAAHAMKFADRIASVYLAAHRGFARAPRRNRTVWF